MNKVNVWIKLMSFFRKYWGCHQMPSRSFFIHGYQMPLCARCTGIIVGEVLGLILVSCCFSINIFYAILMIVPMGIDGIIQLKYNYESTNIRRVLTGCMAGVGIIFCVINAIKFLV